MGTTVTALLRTRQQARDGAHRRLPRLPAARRRAHPGHHRPHVRPAPGRHGQDHRRRRPSTTRSARSLLRVLGDFDMDDRAGHVGARGPRRATAGCSAPTACPASSATTRSAETLRDVADVDECADQLVQLALRGGAPDNVTVVVGDVVEVDTLPDGAAPATDVARRRRGGARPQPADRGGGRRRGRARPPSTPPRPAPGPPEARRRRTSLGRRGRRPRPRRQRRRRVAPCWSCSLVMLGGGRRRRWLGYRLDAGAVLRRASTTGRSRSSGASRRPSARSSCPTSSRRATPGVDRPAARTSRTGSTETHPRRRPRRRPRPRGVRSRREADGRRDADRARRPRRPAATGCALMATVTPHPVARPDASLELGAARPRPRARRRRVRPRRAGDRRDAAGRHLRLRRRPGRARRVGLHVVLRWRAPYADPVILPVAVALNGIGLAMIYRHRPRLRGDAATTPAFAERQLVWTALGVVLAAVA